MEMRVLDALGQVGRDQRVLHRVSGLDDRLDRGPDGIAVVGAEAVVRKREPLQPRLGRQSGAAVIPGEAEVPMAGR